MACSFAAEEALWRAGVARVAGVDEAGRGCLAGPVVAAAVILDPANPPVGIDDSKRLGSARRRELADILTGGGCTAFAIGVAEAAEIDRINILEAAREAMRRAVRGLRPPAAHALVDGLAIPDFPLPSSPLVGGDASSLSIAAASIVAKTARDRLMVELDREFPAYGFARHKGYATREHRDSLAAHGPCAQHRKSFRPVTQLALALD